MPIACTRCGNSEDGEILTAPIAFAFEHARGCGHGIGPLAVVKGKTPKKVESTKKVKKVKKIEPETHDTTNEENTLSTTSTATTETTEVPRITETTE